MSDKKYEYQLEAWVDKLIAQVKLMLNQVENTAAGLELKIQTVYKASELMELSMADMDGPPHLVSTDHILRKLIDAGVRLCNADACDYFTYSTTFVDNALETFAPALVLTDHHGNCMACRDEDDEGRGLCETFSKIILEVCEENLSAPEIEDQSYISSLYLWSMAERAANAA